VPSVAGSSSDTSQRLACKVTDDRRAIAGKRALIDAGPTRRIGKIEAQM
jgi:hypothetical protein